MGWILVSRRNAGIHDLVCRTAVVYDWRARRAPCRPGRENPDATGRVSRRADAALAPRRARSRVDPHLPRGGGRVREAGAAVLGRQGLDRDAAPRREGVLAGPDPVPGDARRHRPQLRRGARVPRPAGRRARRPARRGVGAGVDRRRAGGRGDRARGPAATASRPSRCSTRSPSTASTRCSAAVGATRRRRGRRSACTRSATTSGSGTRRTSGPSCGASTTAGTARVSTSGSSRCRTGPSSTSGSTSHDDDIEIPSIYYAHRREVFRRDGMWLAVSPFVTLMDDEEPVEMLVRFRTVGDASCTGAVESQRGDGRRRDRGGRGVAHHRARARPGPTTGSPRRRWKTARREGYF